MNIMNKIRARAENNSAHEGVTIAFLGDSVTQGCFECYKTEAGGIETIFDKNGAYHRYLDQIFSVLYPNVPTNIINAGVSGGNAVHGLERLERDVLRHQPDLTVVCFGLNDCNNGPEGIGKYTDALETIFGKLKEAGSEILFMTPNMMNTYVSVHLTDAYVREVAERIGENQLNGSLDKYLEAAVATCEKCGVKVCDCYAKWKRLAKNGVDTTSLLANHINHPTREMNWLFAVSLADAILDD